MKIKNLINHPFESAKLISKVFIDKLFYKFIENQSKKFFEYNDLDKYFILGNHEELKIEYIDIKYLYNQVIKRNPKCVLEFGSGFSTIAIALALKKNDELYKTGGKLFSVDGNEEWIKNTRNKINKDLTKYIKFIFDKPYISTHKGQLVSYHKNLPDISPNFIYLDGPAPDDVIGDINGLSFNSKIIKDDDENIFFKKNSRRIVAADVLLYESTAPSDFFILVDRRYSNSNFLEKNLIYDYKIIKNIIFGGKVTFQKKYQPYP